MRKLTTKSLHFTVYGEKKFNDKEVLLNDFHILKKIGEGAFGKVYLVEMKNNRQYYAMKTI